ncbi:MAG: hypothetical protein A2Z97_11685 [Bdellovibrionales bacterium GWB1_52_6]|nr:MAG: hypothetical protein A2Z97_11685 [Bdellovibrionales bacterium GWB1_52_6]
MPKSFLCLERIRAILELPNPPTLSPQRAEFFTPKNAGTGLGEVFNGEMWMVKESNAGNFLSIRYKHDQCHATHFHSSNKPFNSSGPAN